jgi:hypothetical protein
VHLKARPLPIIAAITVGIVAILFPPWTGYIVYHFGGSTGTQELNLGYAPIFAPPPRPVLPASPPPSLAGVPTSSVSINSGLLSGEIGVILALISLHVWWTTIQEQSRRERRSRSQECAECGYALAGNTSGTCPECGTTIPQASRPA